MNAIRVVTDIVQELALRVVNTDAFVSGIRDINVIFSIDCNVTWSPEAVVRARIVACHLGKRAPFAQEFTRLVEDFDTVIPRIRHVHRSIFGDGNAPRFAQRPIRAALVSGTGRTKLADGSAIRAKNLNARIQTVRDIQIAVRANGHVTWMVQLSVGITRFAKRGVGRTGVAANGVEWVLRQCGYFCRTRAKVPHLRGNVLANIEIHGVVQRPIGNVEFLARRLAVNRIIAVPPDIPDTLSQFSAGVPALRPVIGR